jgi:hypothetical protein
MTGIARRSIAVLCFLIVVGHATAEAMPPVRAPRVYRAAKLRYAGAARGVALTLGENTHIVTRLKDGKTHRGHIMSVNEETLRVQLDRTGAALDIPYSEMTYLEQNLTRRAKIAIIAAAAGAAVATIFFLWLEYGD